MKTLPVFQRDPPRSPQRTGLAAGREACGRARQRRPAQKRARAPRRSASCSARSRCCVVSAALACVHVATEKEQREAQAHYDLA